MGSVGISDETQSLPSSVILCEKLKLSRKLLDDNDAVNHASVPRRLRSGMKRRGHESAKTSLSISLNENHLCNEVGTLRKNVLKKSKPNKKPVRITKDEEEVAEALYALAGMFSDAANTDKPGLDHKSNIAQSSTSEMGNAMTAMEETRIRSSGKDHIKIGKKVHLEVACHSSSILDLPQVKLKSLDDSNHLEFLFNKQSPLSVSSGVQSHLSIDPRSKILELGSISNGQGSKILELGSISNGQAIAQEQVVASGVNYHPQYTNCATQSCVTEESATKKKLVDAESRRSWKRCSAHVHISRWIKLSQARDRKEQLSENPTQISIGRHDLEEPSMNLENQMQTQTGGTKSSILSSSSKLLQCSDFLSLAARGGEEQRNEAAKQLHLPYLQPQNSSSLFFSQPQNCSSLHGQPCAMTEQQAQRLPPFLRGAHGNRATAQAGQHWELQQPKWAAPSPLQLCTTGVSTQYFPMLQGEMESPSLFNYLRGENQHQFPQQQFAAISSWMRQNRSLPLGLERNKDMSYPDTISRLKLPFNEHHL